MPAPMESVGEATIRACVQTEQDGWRLLGERCKPITRIVLEVKGTLSLEEEGVLGTQSTLDAGFAINLSMMHNKREGAALAEGAPALNEQ